MKIYLKLTKWLVNGLDHWSIFGVVLRDSNGVPIGIFCVVSENNITNKYLINAVISVFSSRAAAELERKRIDERQKQTEQQLTQANKLNVIGQLAGGITHDLNNLLTVGMGYTNMLVGKIEKSTQLHMFASQVLSTTKRASELTSMLAKYLRKEKIETVPIDLNNLVNDTVLFMENMISKNIEIVRILSFDSMKIMGDRTKLQNVLMNLIINARDAIGKNRGCITVKTVLSVLESESALLQNFQIEPGTYCTVEVSDTGTGMEEETIEHLFEPFFTTKPNGLGTGLGLANVRGYIDIHRGAIEVKSELGKGSCFRLYFPLIL